MHRDAWPGLGSSPLTRGKRRELAGDDCRRRLIPAHAGKTPKPKNPCDPERAHPRSRGENGARFAGAPTVLGSSPLTRGKPHPDGHATVKCGLIPAHAGKTPQTTPSRPSPPAHPRSRGENSGARSGLIRANGSSPLTRGKRGRYLRCCHPARLIPAHAGKTVSIMARTSGEGAHPRSRGENDQLAQGTQGGIGSSPLTRGKPGRGKTTLLQLRLIPAHAGKTLPDLRFYCADRSDLGNP